MCSIKSVQFSDWLWRTSRDRNSTNERSSPWLATGQYEMPTSVHSIDGERLHHRVSHWEYRPMGMRGHVSVCPLRIKNTPFLLARSGPYPWVLTSSHTKWHFNRFGRFCIADAWWSSQQTSVTDSTDRRTTTLPVLWLCVRRGRKKYHIAATSNYILSGR